MQLEQQTESAVATDRLIAYQPALDGLRALAVVMVLCFHHGWNWMRGGYVGVSVFFTLSGFLITTLLLNEHNRHQRISPARFYQRRIKRLLPASLLCLVGVVVLSWVHWVPASSRLRGDVTSAALQVYNWRALTGDLSYAQLLGERKDSAVAHFWSLSIEEQFYWVWPLLVLTLLTLVKSARARRWTVSAVTVVAMVLPRIIAVHWGADAAYWSTPARLSEILLGALVAIWLPVWSARIRRPALGVIGVLGLAVVLWAGATWPRSSGPAYDGLLPPFAVASAAVILGLQASGPLASAFSVRPLVWLGRISFGVYLYHWPVYLVLDEQRTNLLGGRLFVLRVAVTLAVATVSYLVLERPVRHSRVRGRPVVLGALVGVAAVAAVAITVPQPTELFKLEAFQSQHGFLPQTGELARSVLHPSAADPHLPDRPVRMVVVGDSTAMALSSGIDDWAGDRPDLATVEFLSVPVCGLMTSSRVAADTDGGYRRVCDQALGRRLDDILTRGAPDLVVILISAPDAMARVFDDGSELDPFDVEYADRRLADYEAFVDRLSAAGVPHIAWMLAPPPATWYFAEDAERQPGAEAVALSNDTARLLDSPAVCLIDLDGYVTSAEASGDRTLRSDGLHLDEASAASLLADHLGQQLVDVALGNCPDS